MKMHALTWIGWQPVPTPLPVLPATLRIINRCTTLRAKRASRLQRPAFLRSDSTYRINGPSLLSSTLRSVCVQTYLSLLPAWNTTRYSTVCIRRRPYDRYCQTAFDQGADLPARRFQLGRSGQPHASGTRRYRYIHRNTSLRMDIQPGRKQRYALCKRTDQIRFLG